MILLSDEEICEATGTVPFGSTYSAKENEVNFSWGGVRELNKAQLKKVAEWGDGNCEHLESRMGYTRPRRACKKCWQAILKECE